MVAKYIYLDLIPNIATKTLSRQHGCHIPHNRNQITASAHLSSWLAISFCEVLSLLETCKCLGSIILLKDARSHQLTGKFTRRQNFLLITPKRHRFALL
jgi:arginine/ornithine N-succinyltransferase beta subunit